MASYGKLVVCVLIVVIIANALYVDAKGKKKAKQEKGDGEQAIEKTEIDKKVGNETGTKKPIASTTTSSPGTTTAKPKVSTKTPSGSTNAPAASTKAPAGSTKTPAASTKTPAASTKTPAASTKTPGASTKAPEGSKKPIISTNSTDDPDHNALQTLGKLQAEEKKLLLLAREKFLEWKNWLISHNNQSLNRHNIFRLHNEICDYMVSVHKLAINPAPVVKPVDPAAYPAGKRAYARIRGLHTITI